MNLNSSRNYFFWLMDGFKGGKIKNELKEIQFCLENPKSKKAQQIKKTNLDRMLKFAVDSTPFYSSIKSPYSIHDFPVIKKTIIQDNFENFQSYEFKGKENFKVSTSGSTGVPFFLFQNNRKRSRNHADVLFFLNTCHFKLGSRLYELEVWRSHNNKGKIKSWFQNVVQFDISRLTDDRIKLLLNLLKSDKNSTKTLLGFASAFEMISQYLKKNNIYLKDLRINSIIANSEYLNHYTKTTLSKHLNAPVLSRYSSEEIGIIAHQTIDSPNNFVINHASYHVELLNLENDKPVEPGKFGRIVVTDLFNYAMPIIRYDTGDIAKFCLNPNGVMEFEDIEGRKMDLISDSHGNIISSFVIYTKFYKYYHLLNQYQFIQQGEKKYEVKLNLKLETFEFEKELIEDIKTDFGTDADVIITYVNEIPALASGKRKKVVNNFIKY